MSQCYEVDMGSDRLRYDPLKLSLCSVLSRYLSIDVSWSHFT